MSIKPSALDHIERILKNGQEPLFFLDYDGTLTPIAPHPKDALLSQDMTAVLDALSHRFFTAIITGRGLDDIKKLVPLKNIHFAASHGFVFENPGQRPFIYPAAVPFQKKLTDVYERLIVELSEISGVYIENKEFSVAVHDRQVDESELPKIKEVVDRMSQQFPELKVTYGKRVSEFRPNLDWDKGKAVLWMMEDKTDAYPIVIGDDLTDEDAFRAVKGRGITISVQDHPKETEAEYVLHDAQEVQIFLKRYASND